MGDADAAAIRAARGDWVSEHLETYLTSGGTQGHILDLSEVGGRALTTHCLIKCVGRKSAKVYVKPLIYGNVGGEIVIVASKGGADTHPGWYLNVLASNTIGVQIALPAVPHLSAVNQPSDPAGDVGARAADRRLLYGRFELAVSHRLPLGARPWGGIHQAENSSDTQKLPVPAYGHQSFGSLGL
jgi:deazaflavin-dependent oxidoreductase (nitroreductase family)